MGEKKKKTKHDPISWWSIYPVPTEFLMNIQSQVFTPPPEKSGPPPPKYSTKAT